MEVPFTSSAERTNARLVAIVESSDDAIISKDLSGIVSTWNGAAERIFGYTAAEVIGRSISIIIPAERKDEEAQILGKIRKGERVEHYDTVRKRKDGTLIYVSLTVSPIKDSEDNVIGASKIARDITERNRTEEELRMLSVQLDQRVAERTHDLTETRARLRVLASELSLAEQRVRRQIATELHDYLGQLLVVCRLKLTQASQRAKDTDLAQQLKDADRILQESLSYTRSLVAELAPPVLREFGLVMGLTWLAEQMEQHGVTVTMKVTPAPLNVEEDQAILLFQSARELLMNVVKHADTKQAFLSVATAPAGDVLTITVADSGKGFDHALERRTGGKHFGLFSIRERMGALGGRLELKSGPAQGTSASLILPLASHRRAPEPVMAGKGPAAESQERQPGNVRVLMVDDHPLVRQGLRGVLEGYEQVEVVAEAADGREAVQLATKLRPDVVIMDVNMPILDGIEATRLITQACPSMTVIGLSVHQSHQIERSMKEAGAVAYLTKDVAAERLYSAITSALEKKVNG